MHDHCHTTVRQRGNRLLRFTFVFFCLLAWSGWCHADDSQSKAALSQGERLSKVDQSFRKLSLALHYFHDRQGYFSPSIEEHPDYYDAQGCLKVSWRVHLLPFLEQKKLYEQFKLNEPWDSPHNKSLVNKIPDDYKSQGVKQKGDTTCMTFSGTGTPFPDGPGPRLQDFKDGISDTILLVSAGPTKAVPWTKPVDLPLDVKNPARVLGLKSDDSLIIILADGSVKSIPLTISPETLKHLIQPDDGNKIEWPKRK